MPRLTSRGNWRSSSPGCAGRAAPSLAARSAGIQPHIAYETRDYQVTLALVEAELGISLVPASVLGQASGRGIAIRQPHGTTLAREIYLVHRKRPAALVTDMITQLRPRQTI